MIRGKGSRSDPQTFTEALKRLLYGHDLLRHPFFGSDGTLEAKARAAGLRVEPARDVLVRSTEILPKGLDAHIVSGNIAVEPSSSEEWRFTCSMDLALFSRRPAQLALPRTSIGS